MADKHLRPFIAEMKEAYGPIVVEAARDVFGDAWAKALNNGAFLGEWSSSAAFAKFKMGSYVEGLPQEIQAAISVYWGIVAKELERREKFAFIELEEGCSVFDLSVSGYE